MPSIYDRALLLSSAILTLPDGISPEKHDAFIAKLLSPQGAIKFARPTIDGALSSSGATKALKLYQKLYYNPSMLQNLLQTHNITPVQPSGGWTQKKGGAVRPTLGVGAYANAIAASTQQVNGGVITTDIATAVSDTAKTVGGLAEAAKNISSAIGGVTLKDNNSGMTFAQQQALSQQATSPFTAQGGALNTPVGQQVQGNAGLSNLFSNGPKTSPFQSGLNAAMPMNGMSQGYQQSPYGMPGYQQTSPLGYQQSPYGMPGMQGVSGIPGASPLGYQQNQPMSPFLQGNVAGYSMPGQQQQLPHLQQNKLFNWVGQTANRSNLMQQEIYAGMNNGAASLSDNDRRLLGINFNPQPMQAPSVVGTQLYQMISMMESKERLITKIRKQCAMLGYTPPKGLEQLDALQLQSYKEQYMHEIQVERTSEAITAGVVLLGTGLKKLFAEERHWTGPMGSIRFNTLPDRLVKMTDKANWKISIDQTLDENNADIGAVGYLSLMTAFETVQCCITEIPSSTPKSVEGAATGQQQQDAAKPATPKEEEKLETKW